MKRRLIMGSNICQAGVRSTFAVLFALVVLAAACGGGTAEESAVDVDAGDTTAATTEPPAQDESEASPPSSASVPASSSPDESLFEDSFDQALAPEWTWLNEDAAGWSLDNRPGWLTIVTNSAFPPVNQLVYPAPQHAFTVETQLDFAPRTNFQFAGLIVQGDDPGNFVQFGRGFCDAPNICVGDGLYLDNIRNSQPIGSNHATPAGDQSELFLRLTAVESTITAYVSEDGIEWAHVGEHKVEFTVSRVGLVSHQGDGVPAEFADFTMTGTEAHEAPLPRYGDVVANYPGGVPICDTEVALLSTRSDGSWEIELPGGEIVHPTDSGVEAEMPCWGMRIGLEAPVQIGTREFEAGTVLVVDPDSDPAALEARAVLDSAPLLIQSEDLDFQITVGPSQTSWEPPEGVLFIAIDERVEVAVGPAPGEPGSAPLPEGYDGITEQAALDLASSNGVVARVTVRDGTWLPETDEYQNGRLNLIVEDGMVIDGWLEKDAE